MTWKDWLIIAGALSTIMATGWSLGDTYGFRPALKAELQIVASSVDWMQLENYERKLIRQGLTRQECANYRRLAKRLGVEPKPC